MKTIKTVSPYLSALLTVVCVYLALQLKDARGKLADSWFRKIETDLLHSSTIRNGLSDELLEHLDREVIIDVRVARRYFDSHPAYDWWLLKSKDHLKKRQVQVPGDVQVILSSIPESGRRGGSMNYPSWPWPWPEKQ